MLTSELLKSNVTGLTDEQVKAIEVLSKNDEDRVIGERFKEVHDRFDEAVAELTGVSKPGGVKTLDYMKQAVGEKLKGAVPATKLKELEGQITSLTTERDSLQKQLKAGSNDEALKTRITSLEQSIRDKDSELTTLRTAHEKETTDLKGQLQAQQERTVSLELGHSFDAHIVAHKVKFKAGIPDELLQETLRNRKAALMTELKTDHIDDGKGGKVLVLRDDKGEIMRNPDNSLQPYTPGELYMKKIADLVDPGQSQQGGGTKPPGAGGGGGATNLDLSGAKSQVQADQIITTHILKVEGIAKTDPRFAERQKEIRSENKVADLPIREGSTAE